MPSDQTDLFDWKVLQQELEVDEGRRGRPYVDTVGLISIGIGRNLTGRGISDDEIDYLFRNDVHACASIMDKQIRWWRLLPPAKQRVMINLCFMGWGSFSGFHKFMQHMRDGEWNSAADELRSSRWYTQVATRGPRVIARLLQGEMQV